MTLEDDLVKPEDDVEVVGVVERRWNRMGEDRAGPRNV